MITKSYDELLFKLVPVELTPGMIIALNDMCIDAVLAGNVLPIIEAGYKAMLAAAPTPPAEQGEQEPARGKELLEERLLEWAEQYGDFEPSQYDGPMQYHASKPSIVALMRSVIEADRAINPAPSLATLRAKVEKLPAWIDQSPLRSPTLCVSHAGLLALIDKMGGGV